MPSDLAVRPAARALAPRYWGIHLLMVAAVVATVLLGRWQYDVWHDAPRRQRRVGHPAVAVPLDSVLGPDAAYPGDALGRPVTVRAPGTPPDLVRREPRARGPAGYWALTLVTTPSGSQIPVVRGWLPDLDDTAGTADRPRGPGGAASAVGGHRRPAYHDLDADVLPELSITDLLRRTQQGPLRRLRDRHRPRRPRGVAHRPPARPAWRPRAAEHLPGADASTALRNLLYALQWWVFGAFAIFMWWRWLHARTCSGGAAPRTGLRRRVGSGPCPCRKASSSPTGSWRWWSASCSPSARSSSSRPYFAAEGSSLQQFGEDWSILWVAHGWVFIAYVVVSFLLWRQTRWSVPFAMLVLISGLVPLVIFWVEHVVTRRIRAENPELVATPG